MTGSAACFGSSNSFPYRPAREICGADANPFALVGLAHGEALPAWIVDGRCRSGRRPLRLYLGVDLVRV